MDLKAARVRTLQDELRDVHPLLQEIFTSMPGITKVDYRQGPREFGADFILTRSDVLLADSVYIGVIVKSQTITQGSKDIEQQIHECQLMPRSINGKNAYIREIWVVTSQNITQNAKDYFSQLYKSAKIEFIDYSTLVIWIDKFCSHFWTNVPLMLGNYLNSTRGKIETIEAANQFSMFIDVKKSPIKQNLIKIHEKKYQRNSTSFNRKGDQISPESIIGKQGVTIIEGEMGSGKSFLLRTVVKSMCHPEAFNQSKIAPAYVSFKELQQVHYGSLTKFVEQLHKIGVPENTNIAVFLDSFDEVKLSQTDRITRIGELANEATALNRVKLVIASRDIGERAFSNRNIKNIVRYRVAPLSLKQIIQFIQGVCSELAVGGRLAHDLSKSNLFKMLPKTPIAAVLLTKLIRENSTELPSNLTELYSKFTELSLGRWDHEKGLQSEKEYESSKRIIMNIAKYFMESNLQNISVGECLGFFKEYLDKRNLGINHIELFDKIVERSDILVLDKENNCCFFKHRSFAEFFFALGKASSSQLVQSDDFDLYWVSSTYFWTGILRDCPQHLDRLAKCSVQGDKKRLLKMINMGSMLLAAHQSPYEDIQKCLRSAFIEAAIYFSDIKHGRVETPLAGFSEMQLLCIFRCMLSENYGYDFFKGAIEDSMMQIEDETLLDDEVKALALFFLNTSAISLDAHNIFSSMIEKIGVSKLPLNIQLAIGHESDKYEIKSDEISRLFRNIRRFTKDRSIAAQMDNIYETPLARLSAK